jgi:DNA-binding NarL/FixJ family response regulator
MEDKPVIKSSCDNHAKLTGREKQVLRYLQKGLPYKTIAVELQLSIKTIESHASKAFRKCNVSNRFELAELDISQKT